MPANKLSRQEDVELTMDQRGWYIFERLFLFALLDLLISMYLQTELTNHQTTSNSRNGQSGNLAHIL